VGSDATIQQEMELEPHPQAAASPLLPCLRCRPTRSAEDTQVSAEDTPHAVRPRLCPQDMDGMARHDDDSAGVCRGQQQAWDVHCIPTAPGTSTRSTRLCYAACGGSDSVAREAACKRSASCGNSSCSNCQGVAKVEINGVGDEPGDDGLQETAREKEGGH
jgi:hypothetical protein